MYSAPAVGAVHSEALTRAGLGLVCSLCLQSYELNKPLYVSLVMETEYMTICVCMSVVCVCVCCTHMLFFFPTSGTCHLAIATEK